MPHINALTGIRGYAAIWVALFHLSALDIAKPFDFGHVIARGYWAVDIFFMLSGFVLALAYEKKFSERPFKPLYKQYLWARLARLYPLHLLMFAAFLALVLLKNVAGMPLSEPTQFNASGAIASLLLVHSWGTVDRLVWNDVSWSISAEFFAYLFLLPLCFFLRKRLPLWGIACLCIVLWLSVYTLIFSLNPSLDITYHYGVLRILPTFVAGYVLYAYWQRYTLPPFLCNAMLCVVLVGFITLSTLPSSTEYLLFPLIFLLLGSLAFGSECINALFANRATVYLGKISYSLYMTHLLVRTVLDQVLRHVLPHPHPSLLLPLLLGCFMLMLLVAAAAYHLVEEPAQKWLKARF